MKRLWKTACVGLVVAWGLVCGGNTALAEVDGNWEYSYSDSDLTATVTKYNGSSSSPMVPSKFSRRVNTGEKDEDGDYIYKTYTYKVTAVSGTFYGNQNIMSASFPSSVTNIGSSAFCNCTSLTSLPDLSGISTIGSYAFSGCTGLSTIRTPSSLKSLGPSAFKGCTGVTEAQINGDGLIIQDNILEDCSNLVSVVIGDGVTGMNYSLWESGYGRPFKGDTKLKELTVGTGITSVASCLCLSLTGLETVVFRGNVQDIGGSAFSGCSNLKTVSFGGKPVVVGSGAFSWCGNLIGGIDLSECQELGGSAFFGCSSWQFGDLALPKVTSVNSSTFSQCEGLTGIKFSKGLTIIEGGAFQNCTSLSNAWFKSGPPSVGNKPFAEVANGARGHYTSAHRAEWKAVIGSDGKWQGLIMAEIPGPVLRVDSANPAEGSLTLAWDEPATVEGVTYSVYRSANDTYSATDLVTNGLTGTSWTDTTYWSAEPVLNPLNYWVVADGGGYGERASNRVETRHRYGVFVGLSDYSWKYLFEGVKPLPQPAKEAEKLRDLFVSDGGMAANNAELLQNSKAKWESVSNAISAKAEVVLPGDLFVLYVATHGGYANGSAWVVLYDHRLKMTELLGMLGDFNSEAVVVPIIMACHSGTFADYADGSVTNETSQGFKQFVDAGLAMCRGNMPVLASCGAAENSAGFTSFQEYSDFGEAFCHYGWDKGYADGEVSRMGVPRGDGDGFVSFLELIRYAKGFARGLSDASRSHVHWTEEHDQLLTRWKAGRVPTGVILHNAPDAPVAVEASDGTKDSRIDVSWAASTGADWYSVYRLKDGRTGDNDADWTCLLYKTPKTKYQDKSQTELEKEYRYRICAVNGAGASEPSMVATGRRGTSWLLEWLLKQGLRLGLTGTAAELASMPSANGMPLAACYVADIDPMAPHAAFEAELIREDGKWKAKPKGGEKEGRVYRVEGKKEMSDESWTDVTDVEDLEAEGWHFFRIGVELAE